MTFARLIPSRYFTGLAVVDGHKKTGARLASVFLRLFATFWAESLQEVLDLVELVAFRDFYRRDVRMIQTESLVT